MNLLGEFSPLCPHGIQEIVGVSERDKAEGFIFNIYLYGICKTYLKTFDSMGLPGKKGSNAPPP